MFATLTAPSFGPVHHRVVNPDGRVQRCHPGGAATNVTPQMTRPGPGRRPRRLRLHRGGHLERPRGGALASHDHPHRPPPGPPPRGDRSGVSTPGPPLVWQGGRVPGRGVVHFHVIIRLDGPDGPDQPPPEGLTVETLTAAIRGCGRAKRSSPRPTRPPPVAPARFLGRTTRHPADQCQRRRGGRAHRSKGRRLRRQVFDEGG